jgi:Asp-tRNA(Asn)/Glu-tRNA(Gln) amidotransferase A subunit family amidase
MPEPLTITEAAGFIRLGELTPVELLEQCFARIDRYEERVRAWVYLDLPRARAEAERLTAELKAGQNRGPLHAIPIGVKDIIDVFDMPTGCGSKLWAKSIARRDATVVERLRQAGAIIMGKTVTTAFASFDPPVTRNPWNLERTPGGSSSGSAAAVACGMCLGALATQTGGSITRPASYCGVYSIKPTYGRVSVDGVMPLAPSMDHVGAMANCVRDLAILFQVIAGSDERDVRSVDATIPDALSVVDRRLRDGYEEWSGPSLGRLGDVFRERAEALAWEVLDDAFRNYLEANPDAVSHQLAVPTAGFADLLRQHRLVMAVEAASIHRERIARHPEDYPPQITELINHGLAASATDYHEARDAMRRLSVETDHSLAWHPNAVYLTPAATGPAPSAETTGDPVMNSPWSFLGLPTVSIPVAWSPAESGPLPLAVQMTGRHLGELALLGLAARFEASVGSFHRRPIPL